MTGSPMSIETISRRFAISGRCLDCAPLGAGHINDTYLATYLVDGQKKRYIHQRINNHVFPAPEMVMANLDLVTRHLRQVLKKEGHPDLGRASLTIIPTKDNDICHIDPQKRYWRTLAYIEDTQTHQVARTPAMAKAAADAFGRFHKQLAAFPVHRLFEPIADFHNTVKRYTHFEQAVTKDVMNRAAGCQSEIAFALARKKIVATITNLLQNGRIPKRVIHNDPKLNNVLFDRRTGQALCIVDLDTVMPGSVLYDFGGMVRTMVSPAAEDSRDLSQVVVRKSMFEAIVTGYLDQMGDLLNGIEKDLLVFAGRLITLEDGLRFLSDHLNGDIYYKISRPGHNLDRCRNQFALVAAIEKETDALNAIVARRIGT